MEDSWSWEEFNNSTDILNSDSFNNNLCDSVTNHWLYFVFSGYLLPLISPRVRDWFKETLNSLKNNKVMGDVVTLTEYGFNKIQDINDDKEMKDFIKRLCTSKQPGLLIKDEVLENIVKEFSGDEGKSWRLLLKKVSSGNIGHKVIRP